MGRTNIELDDELVAAAMARFGLTTKRSVVELALRRLLASPVDADFIRSLEGIGWDGDLDEMRAGDAQGEW
jgi:Arc/MetJ family transcription regulator